MAAPITPLRGPLPSLQNWRCCGGSKVTICFEEELTGSWGQHCCQGGEVQAALL